MSDTIKPALTAEEWAQGWTVVFGPVGVDEDGGAAAEIRNRHGLAARCLHGQPFGFTWEMVDLLRRLAAFGAAFNRDDDHVIMAKSESFGPGKIGVYHQLTVGALRACADHADRIAALLPPRET